MTVLTANQIVSRLAVAEARSVVSILSDLDDRERAVARDLLANVGKEARIDPVGFVVDVRRRTREADERDRAARTEAAANADPLPYAFSLMPLSQLLKLREELRAKIDRGEGHHPFTLPRRSAMTVRSARHARHGRSIPRVISRRITETADDTVEAISATLTARLPKLPASAVRSPPMPLLRGRGFVGGALIEDEAVSFGRPPWLLDDADPVEPDADEADDFDDDDFNDGED